MKNKLLYLTSVLMLCLGISCSKQKKIGVYSINDQVPMVRLQKELNEISGLEWISDSTIACVQDEKAYVYLINSVTGKIKSKFDFGHNGDFEGIAINDDLTFILRSDGDLFISEKNKKARKYSFKKDGPFDFEGLCLDKKNNRLLVACKEHGSKSKRDNIFIYGFSVKDRKYLNDPLFKIKKEGIHPNFRSSGIDIHPISGDIYVLSSFSKTLLILSETGEVKNKVQLNEAIYHQPEGICFSPNGDLYISNEKNKSYPTLIKINTSN